MSFEESGPFSRVSCHLSTRGVLDAVRNGLIVDSDQTTTFWVESGDPYWPQIFELDPVPEAASDGTITSVHLPVGRVRQATVGPNTWDIARWYGPEIFAWRKPKLVVTYGPQEPLDACGGIDELLEHERSLVEESQPRLASLEREVLPSALASWREWVVEDGLSNAEQLEELVASFAEESKKLAPSIFHDLLVARRNLHAAIGRSKTDATDDAYSALMEIVYSTQDAIDEPESRLDKERVKRVELADAEKWVAKYGSPRLKKGLEVGVLHSSMGAYRDERLAAERPRWSWERDRKTFKDIVNPEESHIDALIRARKVDPDAKLVFSPTDGPMLLSSFLGRYISLSAESVDYGYSEEPF
jgi:hypothetical protein